MGVLEDKMRVAFKGLIDSHTLVFSAIAELRAQGYDTEAANMQSTLDQLLLDTLAAQDAVIP